MSVWCAYAVYSSCNSTLTLTFVFVYRKRHGTNCVPMRVTSWCPVYTESSNKRSRWLKWNLWENRRILCKSGPLSFVWCTAGETGSGRRPSFPIDTVLCFVLLCLLDPIFFRLKHLSPRNENNAMICKSPWSPDLCFSMGKVAGSVSSPTWSSTGTCAEQLTSQTLNLILTLILTLTLLLNSTQ